MTNERNGMAAVEPEGPIRVGVSTCLLGEHVRYDGGHQRDAYITETLGRYFEFVPVCPEVEAGFGIPREAMRLVGDPAAPRLVTTKSGTDMTERMRAFAEERVARLEGENLCGFLFKRNSPSSGMERVKVYPEGGTGMPVKKGVGLFAHAFMERFPLVPVEEDGRLHDPGLRENFIERVFVMRRWRALEALGTKDRAARGRLLAFHARHKLLVMSHSTEHYRALGKLTGAGTWEDVQGVFTEYRHLLLTALALKATPRKHANVLQHVMGYFKKRLSADEKQELIEIIELFRNEVVPLIVPVTLLNHYVRKYREPYLAGQCYLAPHPLELKLRNHV